MLRDDGTLLLTAPRAEGIAAPRTARGGRHAVKSVRGTSRSQLEPTIQPREVG